MSPSCNSRIIPIEDVPMDDLMDETDSITPRQVLVVDDEPLVADTLSAILRKAGFAARAAYSGSAALQLAQQTTPHLLLTDVSMPNMNGIELAMALVAERPACKVLLFSGHATSADLVAATDAGHNFPLLAKPMHPTELLRHVSCMLQVPESRLPEKSGHQPDKSEKRAEPMFKLRAISSRQYA